MDMLATLWDNFSGTLLDVMPKSPFTSVINNLESLPYMGYVNWFFPVGACLKVFSLWLVAYGIYLLFVIVLRWLKVVGQ